MHQGIDFPNIGVIHPISLRKLRLWNLMDIPRVDLNEGRVTNKAHSVSTTISSNNINSVMGENVC